MSKIKSADKCSGCGVTKSKTFWDYPNGTMLCDKCEKKFGNAWETKNSNSAAKMSGWLIFFIVTLVLSCLLNIYLGYSDIAGVLIYLNQPNAFNVYLILFADILIFGGIVVNYAYSAWLMSVRSSNAVPFTKLALVAFLVTNIISLAWLYKLGAEIPAAGDISRAFIYPIIWLGYLNSSKNVEEVYPVNSRKLKTLDYLLLIVPVVGAILMMFA